MNKYIKLRLGLIFAAVFFAVLLFPGWRAQAHELQNDGSIGVIMHTDPDDTPIANQKTMIYLDLKDDLNKFNPVNCDCSISIVKDQSVLSKSQLLFTDQQGQYSATSNFTFPSADKYVVRLTGKSINGSFPDFNLNYDLQVYQSAQAAPETHQHGGSVHTAHFVLFGLGFLGVFYVIWDEKTKESRRNKH